MGEISSIYIFESLLAYLNLFDKKMIEGKKIRKGTDILKFRQCVNFKTELLFSNSIHVK